MQAGSAPPTPTGLGYGAITESSIDLNWNNVTDASYKLYRSPDGVSGWTPIYAGTSTDFRDEPLTAATTYYYRVAALNSQGESPVSTIVSAATNAPAPAPTVAPANLAATGGSDNSVELQWDGVFGATGYEVHRSDDGGGSYVKVYDGSDSRFNDNGVDIAVTYDYKVLAKNAAGPGPFSSPLTVAGGELVITVE